MKKTIVTHDGTFHSDDVFAVALAKLVFPNSEIIRTRDESIISLADIVIDVGGVYDTRNLRFDHHQFTKKQLTRPNEISYSSFGLLWNKFGQEVIDHTYKLNSIDSNLVQIIDAHDNNIDLDVKRKRYSVTQFISLFNRFGNFDSAVNYATLILQAEIGHSPFDVEIKGQYAYGAALKEIFDTNEKFETIREIWKRGELDSKVKRELQKGIMKDVLDFNKEMGIIQQDYPMIRAVNSVAVNNYSKAIELAKVSLDMEISKVTEVFEERDTLQKLFSGKEKYVVLDKEYNEWRSYAVKSNALFVIYPSKDSYRVISAPKKISPEVLKKPFPADWAGKEGSELQEVSGFNDAQFCHMNRFMLKTKTLEGAVDVAKYLSK
ncbi:MYG1 family protein [Candidatus Woesearchaeota archaeon]|nr:MYG1 family protein [Candidatus Woesearchaeota archaeon]